MFIVIIIIIIIIIACGSMWWVVCVCVCLWSAMTLIKLLESTYIINVVIPLHSALFLLSVIGCL